MKNKHLILILSVFIIFSLPVKAQVFDLSSKHSSKITKSQGSSLVYKPSKLVIGTGTKFVIKAEPHSNIELITSNQNMGSAALYGHKLRLGPIVNSYKGVTGENGVAEIEICLPNEKELVGQILYFEVLTWKNKDANDVKIAQIMGIDGRETTVNAVVITDLPKNTSLPGFGTVLPGTNININRTIDELNRNNDYNCNLKEESEEDSVQMEQLYYQSDPLMLRNLRVPK